MIHSGSAPELVAAALGLESGGPLPVSVVDLRDAGTIRHAHADSLAECYRRLGESGLLGPEDWIGLLDHDAHPLDACLFALTGRRLLDDGGLAGVGIPQWHRGHCYLHPSFRLTRAAMVEEMGPDMAFRFRSRGEDGSPLRDTGESFTVWCERHGRPVLPLRVVSTAFPWSRWDSEMAPGSSPRLVGEHGEPVHVGYLMRYGLDERPLVSHVWTLPLRSKLFSDHDTATVLAAYLEEPMTA
ncbi:MAG: hypothetical protein QOH06_737 [Acidobacteriota bacterium]|nr:hypothetical protein [Acidobacteriota bacterium]